MTITYEIHHELATSLRTKSIFVILAQDGAYRRYEIVGAPLDIDATITAAARLTDLTAAWNAATVIDYAEEKAYRDQKTALLGLIDTELTWLASSAGTATTQATAITLVNRLARENERMLKIWRYWLRNKD